MSSATTQNSSSGTTAANAGGASGRLLSLDVFRGLTIVGMILVNNPGGWGSNYWPLEHAPWFGWTPTDLVFPFFLFIVGTSLAYSLRRYVHGAKIDAAVYWRIARRTVVLILLGLGMGVSYRVFNYLFGDGTSISFSNLRYPGVLVRIALVYFAASLIVLHLGVRAQAVLATVLLLGYWALLGWLPNPHDCQANLSPEGNMIRVVDRAVLGENHMYTQGRTEKTDPEGLLSTLPAIVTALLGYWTGLIVQRKGANGRTVALLAVLGLACFAVGWGWGVWFPISKKLWTSSFVLLTAGIAMVIFAGCLLKFDVWRWRRLARPFEIVGVNAIFVFVASGLLAQLLGIVQIGGGSAHSWLYSHLFTSWIADPKLASLGFALATVAFWWLILWAMSRRGWSVRV
jgi:predicted acyltransferase